MIFPSIESIKENTPARVWQAYKQRSTQFGDNKNRSGKSYVADPAKDPQVLTAMQLKSEGEEPATTPAPEETNGGDFKTNTAGPVGVSNTVPTNISQG